MTRLPLQPIWVRFAVRRPFLVLTAALTAWCGLAVSAYAEAKLAFVVGVDAYTNLRPEFQLERPSSDAEVVGQTLTGLGYQVTLLERTVTQETLLRRFTDFAARIQPGDTVMFYFAGHGIALENTNYLLPSDIPALESGQELLVRTRSIAETDVRQLLRERGARVVVMVIDACRDNPFPRPTGTRGLGQSRGLVPAEPAEGVFTLYSASLGQQALDRLPGRDDSRNSVFTRIFVAELLKPGQNLLDLGENVRDNVSALAESAHLKQTPSYYTEVRGARRIYLGGPPNATPDVASAPPPAAVASITPIPAPSLPTPPALAVGRSVLAGNDLAELRNRLYELNFDPDTDGAKSLASSIREFEESNRLASTGVPSTGLLQRLRDLDGLKPWGSIVYDRANEKWGMGWGHPTRRAAVADARSKCGGAACAKEISFFGQGCGAFALSSSNWSLFARDNANDAARAALEGCSKPGKTCRIIGSVCADGASRVVN